jgi:hypothetical protein
MVNSKYNFVKDFTLKIKKLTRHIEQIFILGRKFFELETLV